MIHDENKSLGAPSPAEMVMQAAIETQRRLASRPTALNGNMAIGENPPTAEATSTPKQSSAKTEHVLRRLVASIEQLASTATDDPSRHLIKARIATLLELAHSVLPHLGDPELKMRSHDVSDDVGVSSYDYQNLLALAKNAGAGIWTTDSESGEDGLWTVWHADGDSVCRCFSAIGAMPEAIEAEDVARFIAAVSPAKIIEMAAENARLQELLGFKDVTEESTRVDIGLEGRPGCLQTDSLSTCPGCGGPADNGHSRDVPPSPYYCQACNLVPATEITR